MNMNGISHPETITETMLEDHQPSTCQQLMTRIEQLKTVSVTTHESKKQVWLQFISLWCEVLQMSPSVAQSCYEECSLLLPQLFTKINFYDIRKEAYVARENCFACITQLNQTHIKNYIMLATEKQQIGEDCIYYMHVYYLLFIAAQTPSYFPFGVLDEQKFINNHIELFTLFIERVEQSMLEHSQTIVANSYSLGNINEQILMLLWNLTDQTVLVPTLLKCGLVKRALGWLPLSAILTEKGRLPLMSIIHNIARHDDGADELNQHGAIDVVKQYQKIKLENVDSRIVAVSMTLALLSTPEQLKRDKKGINIVLNQLLQLVMDAAKGDRYRRDGFHVSEPLGVLVKMFVVEERTLDYVLCHAETEPPSDMSSTIGLFISLLYKFSDALKGAGRLEQFTLIALLNILWSISFQPNYAQELIKYEEFIATIQKFTENDNEQEILEQYKPRSMEGVKQAANGILHNLNRDNKNDTKSDEHDAVVLDALVSGTVGSINDKPWIMISYSHDNNAFCGQILDLLATHSDTFEIWIDRTHCQGADDLWETIANGMEQACVIVCLLSGQYFESKSCRQEFIYANDSLKKKIVPVLIEGFEPKGWLGIRMTGMKYVRFRDSRQPEQIKMSELLNTILSSLRSSKPLITQNLPSPHHHATPPPVAIITRPTSATLRPLNQWTSTSNDIHAWFAHNRISTQLRDLFDFQTGEEMLGCAQLLIKDYEKQMHVYSRIFAQKYHGNDMPPHEFYRFAKALEQLLKDNPSSSTLIRSHSPAPIKSGACAIL